MKTKNIPLVNGNKARKLYQPLLVALALVLMCAFGATQSFAKNGKAGPYGGGYNGPGPALATVEQAKTMSDDTWVALKGHIIRNIGGKHYEFKDASGSITVEISPKRWQGQNIGAEDLVEIHGKIDKDWTAMEIEVKRIIRH